MIGTPFEQATHVSGKGNISSMNIHNLLLIWESKKKSEVRTLEI